MSDGSKLVRDERAKLGTKDISNGPIKRWMTTDLSLYLQERGRLRSPQSGASQAGGGGRALERFCVEQLAGVSGGPVEASGVVAGGSVAGRVGYPRGQSGRAATV